MYENKSHSFQNNAHFDSKFYAGKQLSWYLVLCTVGFWPVGYSQTNSPRSSSPIIQKSWQCCQLT